MTRKGSNVFPIACILLFVFPTAVVVFHLLFALPISFVVAPFAGSSRWPLLVVEVAGWSAGVAGGVWACALAWPGASERRRANRDATHPAETAR